MKAENENPDPPRCHSCGRYMETLVTKERLKVYGCCGDRRTKFRPQFVQPNERLFR